MQILPLKQDVGNHGKDGETDALLNDLQLHKIEWAAIAIKSHTVGWHLAAILEECYTP